MAIEVEKVQQRYIRYSNNFDTADKLLKRSFKYLYPLAVVLIVLAMLGQRTDKTVFLILFCLVLPIAFYYAQVAYYHDLVMGGPSRAINRSLGTNCKWYLEHFACLYEGDTPEQWQFTGGPFDGRFHIVIGLVENEERYWVTYVQSNKSKSVSVDSYELALAAIASLKENSQT